MNKRREKTQIRHFCDNAKKNFAHIDWPRPRNAKKNMRYDQFRKPSHTHTTAKHWLTLRERETIYANDRADRRKRERSQISNLAPSGGWRPGGCAGARTYKSRSQSERSWGGSRDARRAGAKAARRLTRSPVDWSRLADNGDDECSRPWPDVGLLLAGEARKFELSNSKFAPIDRCVCFFFNESNVGIAAFRVRFLPFFRKMYFDTQEASRGGYH